MVILDLLFDFFLPPLRPFPCVDMVSAWEYVGEFV